ncbi:indigoidine synthase A-like protein [Infundibulicybe gibba]|nr:indigoidine synthase A-like protein [Infundibulicybe gibba]
MNVAIAPAASSRTDCMMAVVSSRTWESTQTPSGISVVASMEAEFNISRVHTGLRPGTHIYILDERMAFRRHMVIARVSNSFHTITEAVGRGAPIDVHPEIQEAMASNKPVVALETTLVTHGFPYPVNMDLALSLEQITRSTGSIPATIGMINGRIKIGMERHELQRLADTGNNPNLTKLSRRDIAPAMALKMDGGTTCSTTMIFAALAGIKVFATGGLGGVHRGGESSMDISADLQELSRCPVGLVSAGVKSILDIGRTLEYLETLGVPVVTYGESREFPAFFSRHSGFHVPWNAKDPATAAGMLCKPLIAVPIPEEYEARGAIIQKSVDQAVAESEANGLTKGSSLESNIALLRNTALIGGQIAAKYQELENSESSADLMIIGSAAVDITSQISLNNGAFSKQSTVPGSVRTSLGGVARNIAEASSRILSSQVSSPSPLLVSLIETAGLGMRTDGLITTEKQTAVCNLVLDSDGNLITGIADMDITAALKGPIKSKPKLVAFDGNLSSDAICDIVSYCTERNVPCNEPTSVLKSTSVLPAIVSSLANRSGLGAPITFASPNLLELKHMYHTATEEPFNLMSHPDWWTTIDHFSLDSSFRTDLERLSKMTTSDSSKDTLSFLVEQGVAQMAIHLLPFFQHLIIKCGEQGAIVAMCIPSPGPSTSWYHETSHARKRYVIARGKNGQLLVLYHFPPLPLDTVVNVTGAGDSFVGALLAGLVLNQKVLQDKSLLINLINNAQSAAVLTLKSHSAVSVLLSEMGKMN